MLLATGCECAEFLVVVFIEVIAVKLNDDSVSLSFSKILKYLLILKPVTLSPVPHIQLCFAPQLGNCSLEKLNNSVCDAGWYVLLFIIC